MLGIIGISCILHIVSGYNLFQDSFSYPFFDVKLQEEFPIAYDDAALAAGASQPNMIILSMHGEPYLCDLTSANAVLEARALDSVDDGEWPIGGNMTEYIPQTLQALGALDAPVYTYGSPLSFWGYKLRYGDQIVQLYAKQDTWSPIEGVPSYVIGDFSKTNLAKESSIEYNGESYYLKQNIGHGTMCEIIGQRRSAEVHFVCAPEHEEGIMSIGEMRTCHYKVVVNSPELCKIPIFRPAEEPPAEIISCQRISAL